METNYFLNDDCVCNMSELFCIDIASTISITHSNYSKFIFEIKYCDKYFYYRDPSRFYKLKTLKVSKHITSFDLSKMTLLESIDNCPKSLIDHVSNLINLKNITFELNVSLNDRSICSSLTLLENIDGLFPYHFSYDSLNKFVNLTSIKTGSFEKLHSIDQLIFLNKLKELECSKFDMQNLSTLTSLNCLHCHNKNNVNILSMNHLQYVKFTCCDDFDINDNNNIRTALLYYSYPKNDLRNINLECLDIETHHNKPKQFSFDSCINLKDISVAGTFKLKIDNEVIIHNLTKLKLLRTPITIDLSSYHNLKSLELKLNHFQNLTCLTGLQSLRLELSSTNDKIDLRHHLQLTNLCIYAGKFKKLKLLTNLIFLEIFEFKYDQDLTMLKNITYLGINNFNGKFKNIINLNKLIHLNLYVKCNHQDETQKINVMKLTRLNDLKIIKSNMHLKNIGLLTNLEILSCRIYSKYHNDIIYLTRLEKLKLRLFSVSSKDKINVDTSLLTRLEKCDIAEWGVYGPTGPTGVCGPTGAIGSMGIQGFTGPVGSTDAIGSMGIQGFTGPVGR